MERKTIFISGAAAGIGRATSIRFASEGWLIGAFDLDEKGLGTLRSQLGERNCVTGPLNVTDSASVDAALKRFTDATLGRLDVLFNCAGILYVGPFETMTREEHRRQIDVNVKGLVDCTLAAFPFLKNTSGSRVINMSSASATYGIPDFATYSATKHAVRALTEGLNLEWEKYGIHVCDIMPPFVNTGMVKNASPSNVIKGLGVKLAAEDVAETVWQASQGTEIHWPVGSQFRTMWKLSGLFPEKFTRSMLKRVYKGD